MFLIHRVMQITSEQSACRQHIVEHYPFKLYNTSQNCSVEIGYLDNLRNGVVVLDDTLLRLRQIKRKFTDFSARRVVGACKCRVTTELNTSMRVTA